VFATCSGVTSRRCKCQKAQKAGTAAAAATQEKHEATTTWEEITWERQMHNTEVKDNPSHGVKYVDLIFCATGQVAGWCLGKTQRGKL